MAAAPLSVSTRTIAAGDCGAPARQTIAPSMALIKPQS
jgi:hypothetical protein